MTKPRHQESEPLTESLEFSRPVFLRDIPAIGARFSLMASRAEREALARRFDVLSILALQSEISVFPSADSEGVRIVGDVSACLAQECGVTLEHFESAVTATFERRYVFFAPNDESGDVVCHVESRDPPECAPNGWADLGDIVAEEFGLRIDPFPRRPGVTFVFNDGEEEAQGPSLGPFSILKRLSFEK